MWASGNLGLGEIGPPQTQFEYHSYCDFIWFYMILYGFHMILYGFHMIFGGVADFFGFTVFFQFSGFSGNSNVRPEIPTTTSVRF